MPIWPARLVIRLPRLRLTLPFSVETASFLFSSTASSCSCAERLASSQSRCAVERFEHLFRPRPATWRSPPAAGPASSLVSPGRTFFQFFFDVDVFVELVDQVVADGAADRFVLQQAAAGRDPVVGVERLTLDPDREDAEEGEHRAEHDQGFDRASTSAAHTGGMVYVTDEARGHSPHNRDHRERSAQRRLLRRRTGLEAGQENRQPGLADRVPPLLRRRGR